MKKPTGKQVYRWTLGILLLILAVLLLRPPILRALTEAKVRRETKESFQALRNEYIADLDASFLPLLLESTEDYVEINASEFDTSFSFGYNDVLGTQIMKNKEYTTLTLTVSDDFDTWSKRAQYTYLISVRNLADNTVSAIKEAHKDYLAYLEDGSREELLEEAYDDVYIKHEAYNHIIIKTSTNTYEDDQYGIDCLIINGQWEYAGLSALPLPSAQPSPTPTPSPTPRRNYKPGSYDPYDVEDFDDGGDFAQYWAEEFGDGDYDEGYDDAYDYWEDHQEE